MLQQMWEQSTTDFDAELLSGNISVAKPADPASRTTLKSYLQKWRTQTLGHSVIDGQVIWGECHILSQRGRNSGRPIALATRIDYANDAQQLEASDDSSFTLSDPHLLRKVRTLLSPWITKPTHYNGLRNTLSRVFSHAVDSGLIDRNPMADIKKVNEPKREVLVPDHVFAEITALLCVHKLNKQAHDGTWRAKICDLIYMMSQQPIDVFGLKEDQIHDDQGPFGEIHFARHKTGVPIIIEMNKELRQLVDWFREWKRKQGIISPYLMVYPQYFDKRSRTKPVKHRFMQLSWAQACTDAGYKGQYQLRDLRKKGLTDEFVSQGENNKGGHETEAMRKHYRLIRPPERSKSTLKSLRKDSSA
ncbi:hypothetical protein BG841_13990 [Marinobacter sp. X15-166B]|nr:hypothetical protein BG841_13990 [Marinobacter sp. X15-166B]